ncbi:MAG: hypothetical protein N3B11_04425 [Coriobacteriia bacterium]|nr:hypothetical protein [Coriobacteriia bacterium]
MSDQRQPVTVDDLRLKARRIEDMVRTEARRFAERDAAKAAALAALVVLAALGAAYYAGTRRSCA